MTEATAPGVTTAQACGLTLVYHGSPVSAL
jgi:hypothetical protein